MTQTLIDCSDSGERKIVLCSSGSLFNRRWHLKSFHLPMVVSRSLEWQYFGSRTTLTFPVTHASYYYCRTNEIEEIQSVRGPGPSPSDELPSIRRSRAGGTASHSPLVPLEAGTPGSFCVVRQNCDRDLICSRFSRSFALPWLPQGLLDKLEMRKPASWRRGSGISGIERGRRYLID